MTKQINIYNGARTNVLEDDPDMKELILEIFRRNGLPDPMFFTDSDLFVKGTDENVHICILDQKIDGSLLQGIDVFKIIRTRFPKCKIIFMTGTSDPKILKQLLRLKPDGYVDKDDPNYIRILVEETEQLLAPILSNFEFAEGLQGIKDIR
jgi:DNA-binding NtrC family response regulator